MEVRLICLSSKGSWGKDPGTYEDSGPMTLFRGLRTQYPTRTQSSGLCEVWKIVPASFCWLWTSFWFFFYCWLSACWFWLTCHAGFEHKTKVERSTNIRSSHRRCSVKKGVFKNFPNFTGKHLCQSLFLIKLQAFRQAILLKRGSNTGLFLWNLRNF